MKLIKTKIGTDRHKSVELLEIKIWECRGKIVKLIQTNIERGKNMNLIEV